MESLWKRKHVSIFSAVVADMRRLSSETKSIVFLQKDPCVSRRRARTCSDATTPHTLTLCEQQLIQRLYPRTWQSKRQVWNCCSDSYCCVPYETSALSLWYKCQSVWSFSVSSHETCRFFGNRNAGSLERAVHL